MAPDSKNAVTQTVTQELESPRLQQVRDHFRDVQAPFHVVASAAIFRASKIVSSRMEAALAGIDLTPPRYEILGLLHNTEGGRLSLRELGRATLHHPATMTYTLDSLERRGLLKRQPDPSDRRAILAEITPKGRDLVRAATVLLDNITWGLRELSDDVAEALSIMLSKLLST